MPAETMARGCDSAEAPGRRDGVRGLRQTVLCFQEPELRTTGLSDGAGRGVGLAPGLTNKGSD